jgi:hypothetical protein
MTSYAVCCGCCASVAASTQMRKHLLDQGLQELARDEDAPLTREDLRSIADDAKRRGSRRRGFGA